MAEPGLEFSLLAMICHQGPESLQLSPEQFCLLDLQGIGDENEFFVALCEGLALPRTLRGWQLGRALRQRDQSYVVCLDQIEKIVNPHGCFTIELMRCWVLHTSTQQY
jgi:hypothetical protein